MLFAGSVVFDGRGRFWVDPKHKGLVPRVRLDDALDDFDRLGKVRSPVDVGDENRLRAILRIHETPDGGDRGLERNARALSVAENHPDISPHVQVIGLQPDRVRTNSVGQHINFNSAHHRPTAAGIRARGPDTPRALAYLDRKVRDTLVVILERELAAGLGGVRVRHVKDTT